MSDATTATTPHTVSRFSQYMTLAAALLGWMFDGFEMGLFPLIGKAAIKSLLGPTAADAEIDGWFGAIIAVFLVGAATGGVLFGWLGDKIGRVRAMSISIFTFAVFTGLCGFATEAWHIAVLRFIASLGMGGEWSLGVALVNEIWPGKSRAFIAGLIGAAANVGFLMVALLSIGLSEFIDSVNSLLLAIGLSAETTGNLLDDSAWRFLMVCGAFPALLIFLIRLFVPESSKWQEEHARGTTSNWQNSDLYGILICGLAALVIIWAWLPARTNLPTLAKIVITFVGLAIVFTGYLYPVRKYLQRATAKGSLPAQMQQQVLRRLLLGAGLASVSLLGTWGSIQWAPKYAAELKPNIAATADSPAVIFHAKEYTQIATATGAILGTIVAAVCAGRFGRRKTFTVMCAASFAAAVLFLHGNSEFGIMFVVTAFLAGGTTASFYGFFPLYFPELFPTAVRATGQGFSFNCGRIVAAIGGLQTANLTAAFGSFPMAGTVISCVYIIGAILIWFGPETKQLELQD